MSETARAARGNWIETAMTGKPGHVWCVSPVEQRWLCGRRSMWGLLGSCPKPSSRIEGLLQQEDRGDHQIQRLGKQS